MPGGDVYAPSGLADRLALKSGFRKPSVGLSPGMIGLVGYEGLFRHFLRIQQALEQGELDNLYWLQGMGNPADGLTKVRSGMAPTLRLMESGKIGPGPLCPLKGIRSKEKGVAGNLVIPV